MRLTCTLTEGAKTAMRSLQQKLVLWQPVSLRVSPSLTARRLSTFQGIRPRQLTLLSSRQANFTNVVNCPATAVMLMRETVIATFMSGHRSLISVRCVLSPPTSRPMVPGYALHAPPSPTPPNLEASRARV